MRNYILLYAYRIQQQRQNVSLSNQQKNAINFTRNHKRRQPMKEHESSFAIHAKATHIRTQTKTATSKADFSYWPSAVILMANSACVHALTLKVSQQSEESYWPQNVAWRRNAEQANSRRLTKQTRHRRRLAESSAVSLSCDGKLVFASFCKTRCYLKSENKPQFPKHKTYSLELSETDSC